MKLKIKVAGWDRGRDNVLSGGASSCEHGRIHKLHYIGRLQSWLCFLAAADRLRLVPFVVQVFLAGAVWTSPLQLRQFNLMPGAYISGPMVRLLLAVGWTMAARERQL